MMILINVFLGEKYQILPEKKFQFWARKHIMPEKKTENSSKSTRERRFLPKRNCRFMPEKPKKVPEKKMTSFAPEI